MKPKDDHRTLEKDDLQVCPLVVLGQSGDSRFRNNEREPLSRQSLIYNRAILSHRQSGRAAS